MPEAIHRHLELFPNLNGKFYEILREGRRWLSNPADRLFRKGIDLPPFPRMLKKLKKANHLERILFDAGEGWNRVEKSGIIDREKFRNKIEKIQLNLNESFFFSLDGTAC